MFAVTYDVTHTTYILAETPVLVHSSPFTIMQRISIEPSTQAPIRDLPPLTHTPLQLPTAKATKLHPSEPDTNASLFFVGTATTIMFVRRSNPYGN